MALLEPYGWISIINLSSLTLVTKFQAFERAEFTLWLSEGAFKLLHFTLEYRNKKRIMIFRLLPFKKFETKIIREGHYSP